MDTLKDMYERPIIIAAYQEDWPARFLLESEEIVTGCAGMSLAIEHIGSTSVPGLGAKPIIDVMVGVDDEEAASALIATLQSLDYTFWPGFFDRIPGRYEFLFKEQHSQRVFNLHLVEKGGVFWRRHLIFRDYLRDNPNVAEAYQLLKEQLAVRHSPDMDAYALAKTDFIRQVEKQAGWQH